MTSFNFPFKYQETAGGFIFVLLLPWSGDARVWKQPVFAVCVLVCALYMLYPRAMSAQDAAPVVGLERGEKDTMRLDLRMEGREEQDIDARISDQKIGYEERKIRLERRAEELLREEEVARTRQEEWVESEEERKARARMREQEDIQRKKQTVDAVPDL